MQTKNKFLFLFFLAPSLQAFGPWNKLTPTTQTRVLRMAGSAMPTALYFRYGPPYKHFKKMHTVAETGAEALNKTSKPSFYKTSYPSPEFDALVSGASMGILVTEITALASTVFSELCSREDSKEKKDPDKKETL